jgi:glycerophosphoryl diester phosphodiesterase
VSRQARWPHQHPWLIAHRGDSARFPENTLPAFAAAIEVGVDAIELDLHRSAGGELVVIHDPELARTTGASGRVGDWTLDGLRRLDAGSCCGAEHAGTRLPLLGEVLELARGRAAVCIELKEPYAAHPDLSAAVLAEARRHHMLDTVLLLAFDHAHLQAARAENPEAVTVALTTSRPRDPGALLQETQANAIGAHWPAVDAPMCTALHAAGGAVLAWTVDDPGNARRLVGDGVDGIVTNCPADFPRGWSR